MSDNAATSFGGILKKMCVEARTGRLHVESPDGKVSIHIEQGRIVNVNGNLEGEWIAGNYLVATGALSASRMLKALAISQKRGVAPLQVVAVKKWVSVDLLSRWAEFEAKESILPLFFKVGILVRYVATPPEHDPLLTPVPIPMLLKEGVRRIREWPNLSKRVAGPDAIYARDLSQIAEDSSDGEIILGDSQGIGPNERIVYFFVDGKRNIKDLARISGLSVFHTCQAVFNLEAKFLIKPAGSRKSSALPRRNVIPAFFRLAIGVGILMALAALVVIQPGPIKLLTGKDRPDVDAYIHAKAQQTRENLIQCIEDDYLMTGRLARTPDNLHCIGDSNRFAADIFDYVVDEERGYYLQTKREVTKKPGPR